MADIVATLDPATMGTFEKYRGAFTKYKKKPSYHDPDSIILSTASASQLKNQFDIPLDNISLEEFKCLVGEHILNPKVVQTLAELIEPDLDSLYQCTCEKSLKENFMALLSQLLPEVVTITSEISPKLKTLLYGKFHRSKADIVLLENGGCCIGVIETKTELKDVKAIYQALGYVLALEFPSRLKKYGRLKDAVMMVFSKTASFLCVVSPPLFYSTEGYSCKYLEFNRSEAAEVLASFLLYSLSLLFKQFVPEISNLKLDTRCSTPADLNACQDSLLGLEVTKVNDILHPGSGVHHGLLLFCNKVQLDCIEGQLNLNAVVYSLTQSGDNKDNEGISYVIKVICSFYGMHHKKLTDSQIGFSYSLLSLLLELQNPRWVLFPKPILGIKAFVEDPNKLIEELCGYRSSLRELLSVTLCKVRCCALQS
eukprot:GHVR01182245.1.p1 GENE.GHVR01182245.1~~GHVR01182245.1.p1  ORF type:complete len:425 (-),score=7.51 GHVR01182245.1:227-1501(-)